MEFIIKLIFGLLIFWALILIAGLYCAFNGDTTNSALQQHIQTEQQHIQTEQQKIK
jgi:amino acid permease